MGSAVGIAANGTRQTDCFPLTVPVFVVNGYIYSYCVS
jgi:hypothetical protein